MAQHDLGDLGPKESAAVAASWRLVDNLSGLAVWGLLIAAIVLLKENRNPKVFSILVPLIVVNGLWMGIKFLLVRFANMPSPALLIFDTLVAGFTVGMAVVLLVAGRFRRMNRFVIVLLAFLVMVLAFAAAVAGSMQFDDEMGQSGMFFAVMTLAALMALVVAGTFCRRRFGAGKFAIWVGLWCVLFCVALLLVAVVIMMGGDIPPFTEILLVGGIMGVILYVFLVPFLVLAMRSDLFRERFYGCYRLKGMVASEGGEAPE